MRGCRKRFPFCDYLSRLCLYLILRDCFRRRKNSGSAENDNVNKESQYHDKTFRVGVRRSGRDSAFRRKENISKRQALSRAVELAEKYGATAYESLEEAVTADGVDGVYVNVTNNVHFEYAVKALECGKPVLLEKPMVTRAEQLERLMEVAKERDVYLAEAMWTWYSDQAIGVRELVSGGELGKVRHAEISLCLPIAFSKKNRLLRPELAGGALLDLGIYPVTYAYRLFGYPKAVRSAAKFKYGVDTKST